MKKTETTNLIRMCPKAVNLSVTSLLCSYTFGNVNIYAGLL